MIKYKIITSLEARFVQRLGLVVKRTRAIPFVGRFFLPTTAGNARGDDDRRMPTLADGIYSTTAAHHSVQTETNRIKIKNR